MFSTCARLLLVGLVASCATEPADPGSTEAIDTAQAAGASSADLAIAAADHDAFALTTEGFIRGVATDTMRAFKGIPYAAAPVGDLRWQPTQRHARWTNVLDTTRFGDHCPQVGGAFGVGSVTEDCLFLNVFTPAGRDRDRDAFGLHPVMVWIHGGALVTGESDDYDPTRLVEQGDVIVVTINYRLGALGFMAHPALTAESSDHASGNYGLMDQQEALRWVRRNILFFGGDPTRVTVFGESAGGLSVHSQLASPGAQGLFQRAIVESGAYQLTQPSLSTAENAGSAFATRAGCTDQTAACLRGLSVEQVLASQATGLNAASPTIDNKVLTQSIATAFTSGQFHHVPVIEGANHDEWRLFVAGAELTGGVLTAAGYPIAIQATLRVPAAVVPLFTTQYPVDSFPSPSLALSSLGSDGIFDCPARFVAQKLSQFVPTFAYEFNDPDAPQRFLPPVSFPYASAHASEIQYLFNLPVTVPFPGLDAAQEQLSAAMVDYWTTFARTGQPSSSGTPVWPRYQTATDTMQSLAPATPRPTTGFAADHKCAFWDALRQ
ncbi:MAG TPA: carboxylesterase family protein [Kofleriaceae bacterium]|nr:carboxylesterase family protein [Kofleriaceae bacterium]